jgi:hypothetical protein
MPNQHLAIRAAFVAKGTSLYGWCRQNNISRQLADAALKGLRKGPKARELAKKIADAAGVELKG